MHVNYASCLRLLSVRSLLIMGRPPWEHRGRPQRQGKGPVHSAPLCSSCLEPGCGVCSDRGRVQSHQHYRDQPAWGWQKCDVISFLPRIYITLQGVLKKCHYVSNCHNSLKNRNESRVSLEILVCTYLYRMFQKNGRYIQMDCQSLSIPITPKEKWACERLIWSCL